MADKNFNWQKLGIRLAEMRAARGVTQQQLAEMADLSVAYVGYIEQGQRHGTLATYLSIVSALGYTLNDLISDKPLNETAIILPDDITRALTVCESEERETILRIIRELTGMIRHHHGGDQ